jgi:hypothetical protein
VSERERERERERETCKYVCAKDTLAAADVPSEEMKGAEK